MKYLKIAVIVTLTFVLSHVQAQEIKWQENSRLTWDDFKGKPDYKRKPLAVTNSKIIYDYRCERKDSLYIITFSLANVFYQNWSWAKFEHRNDIVLGHEQLHFDIDELYTRKLAAAFKSQLYTSNYKAEIDSIYKKVIDECGKTQAKYDSEASNDISLLYKWQIFIYLELKKLPRNY